MKKGSKHTEETKMKLRGHQHKGSGIYPRTDFHKEMTRKGIKKLYDKGIKMGFRVKKYFNTGKKNNNWKGGITPIHEKIRKSEPYQYWRRAIFQRDNYTCVLCKQRGGIKHADHYPIPFSAILNKLIIEQGLENLYQKALKYEMFWVIDNGRTLCINCHKKTNTYGWKLKYKNYASKRS